MTTTNKKNVITPKSAVTNAVTGSYSGYGDYLSKKPTTLQVSPTSTNGTTGNVQVGTTSGYGAYLSQKPITAASANATSSVPKTTTSGYGAYLSGKSSTQSSTLPTTSSQAATLVSKIAPSKPVAVQASSYAEYLSGKPATTTPTPTTSGYGAYLSQPVMQTASGSGYGKWLTTQQNNHKVENTPTGAKSYAEWLTGNAVDPAETYKETVKSGYGAYLAGLSTHGQTAEKLAQNGMTGGGYGEYLAGKSYSTYQNTVQQAQKDATKALDATKSGYGAYLAGLTETNTASTEVKQAKTAEALSTLSSMMEAGGTLESSLAALNGLYDADVLETVKNNYVKTQTTTNSDRVNNAVGIVDYWTDAKNQQARGLFSDQAAFNNYVGRGRAKNYEFVKAIAEGRSADWTAINQYASSVGLQLSGTTSDSMDAVVDHMAANGIIEGSARQEYYALVETKNINSKTYSAKEASNHVSTINDMLSSGQINATQRDQLLATLGAKVEGEYGAVAPTGIKWLKVSPNGNGTELRYTTTVYYTQNGAKGAIDLQYRTSGVNNAVSGDGFRELWANGDNSIGVIGGQIVLKVGDKYYNASYTSGTENNKFIAWALTHAK